MAERLAKLIAFPGRREPARLLNLAEICELFGYSERWFRYRIAEPRFPVHRWGRQLRFDPAEVKAWLEGRYGD